MPLHEDILSGVTEASPNSNVLRDVNFGGIGTVLGFANSSVVNPRFDSNNQSWMSGGVSGNVYAIWNDGQFVNDTTNANSYALIAGNNQATAIEWEVPLILLMESLLGQMVLQIQL